jgi:hypothetical protein
MFKTLREFVSFTEKILCSPVPCLGRYPEEQRRALSTFSQEAFLGGSSKILCHENEREHIIVYFQYN